MSYYDQVYLKRLNRYGNDYQERKQGHREREFEDYLKKSVYRIDFTYNTAMYPAILEPYKEDKTKTQGYLLTRIDVDIPAGTVLSLPNKDGVEEDWLVWWLEYMEASGYNRYIVLKLTHTLTWKDELGATVSQPAYFYGPGTAKIRDSVKSHNGRSGSSIYLENNNLYMFITYASSNIQKDVYFEVTTANVTQAYRVVDFDLTSTVGVEYVSVDPVYVRDHSAPVEPTSEDTDAEFYWLRQGRPIVEEDTHGST